MRFRPEEVLFLATTDCNLDCPHCVAVRSKKVLPKRSAIKFLIDCKRLGINRVGFTGGEPFLAPDFLCAVSDKAREEGMIFDRIMTNGVWFRGLRELSNRLHSLKGKGYDGSICVSVDIFHGQDLRKVALFIREASSVWGRPDIISIVYTGGSKESRTMTKLKRLSRLLRGRLAGCASSHPYIRNKDFFIKIHRIDLSPIGKAGLLKNPWDGRWFKEDRCKGPGNVLFIMPNGDVKPCCGYATNLKELTIGNIRRDSVERIMRNIGKNRFVYTIFSSGLSAIRRRLERLGAGLPGKTSNNCFFCHYAAKAIPRRLLNKCLD